MGDNASNTDPETVLRRARWMWRVCLLLPFLYMGIAWLVAHFFFHKTYSFGFWPMAAATHRKVLIGFGLLALCAQVVVIFLHQTFQSRIRQVRLIPPEAAQLYWRRTLYMAVCADFVSGLGLIAFLLNADWTALVGLCIFSYFLYVQAYPRARFLER